MVRTSNWQLINALRDSVVVSCQADEGEPLGRPEHINALAQSAIMGGAAGLRLEGVANLVFVRSRTRVPIIGLIKSEAVMQSERSEHVYITATKRDVLAIAGAGADIVALDATARIRSDGSSLSELVKLAHEKLNTPVWADIDSIESAQHAVEHGADVVSTTLYGYTRRTLKSDDAPPDFNLLDQLCCKSGVPVVLEGRVWEPEQVKHAFECGAWAVVVGSAITRPQLITRRFVAAAAKARLREQERA